MPARTSGHRKHFAIEKFAFEFRSALHFKILRFGQTVTWFR
jgi:hypothetical protein